MLSSNFESDYLTVKVSMTGLSAPVQRYINFINEFPEGSARRLEMEASLLSLLSDYVATLARDVRDSGAVTLYDII